MEFSLSTLRFHRKQPALERENLVRLHLEPHHPQEPAMSVTSRENAVARREAERHLGALPVSGYSQRTVRRGLPTRRVTRSTTLITGWHSAFVRYASTHGKPRLKIHVERLKRATAGQSSYSREHASPPLPWRLLNACGAGRWVGVLGSSVREPQPLDEAPEARRVPQVVQDRITLRYGM